MEKEAELGLSKYLLNMKLNNDLRKLCKDNGLKSSGNKSELIETIVKSLSFNIILIYTEEMRRSGLPMSAELLLLRKELGEKTFNQLVTLTPLNVPESLLIVALLNGPKKKSEILFSPDFKRFLELASSESAEQGELGEKILKNSRSTLVPSGILKLKSGTWEYSLDPHAVDYIREIGILGPEELFNVLKQSRTEQLELNLNLINEERQERFPIRISVTPIKTFQKSPSRVMTSYIGRLGEELAARHLLKERYDVCRLPVVYSRNDLFTNPEIELALCPHLRCKRPKTEVEALCSKDEKTKECVLFGIDGSSEKPICPCTHLFPDLCESCDEKSLCPIHAIFSLLFKRGDEGSKKPFHAADFIAHKGGNNYLVEVKTNRERDKLLQEETLHKMRRFGLEPLIVHVTLPLEHSTFKIIELPKKIEN